MRGNEIIDRVKEFARQHGIRFRFDPHRGKGIHGTIYLGTRFTVLPDPRKELKKGTLSSMCRSLGMKPQDLRDL